MVAARTDPVVVFFAFANDRADASRYLRNLPEEQRQVRAAIAAAEKAGHCEVVERANATITEILDVFQDAEYRNRIALFHFGGHAGDAELLLESAEGDSSVAHAAGLARFLGEQEALELVFLNGCCSRGQARGLLDAGVSAVIATAEEIDDAMATEFSVRFYKSLASGAPLQTSYREAAAAVETRHGEGERGATRGIGALERPELPSNALPWDLYHLPGTEEHLGRWSLSLASGDPLFGLPRLPERDLPHRPFKHLEWFTADDADTFFGRGREIRELYKAATLSDAAPIVLLFGGTGVGKSSLLAAGLLPRLESGYEVEYVRRDGAVGLGGALTQILGGRGEGLNEAWRRREQELGRPLVVILDQVEEAWTRPLAGGQEEEALAAGLRQIFGVRATRPQGRLILAFRKEWLAEVLGLLASARLPRPRRIELKHLGREGIVEAVSGAASTDRLRREYGLQIDPNLPLTVAEDLLDDPGAAIAPALQILLTKMWDQATAADPEAPEFSVALYQDLRRRGILLDDFLEEQLIGLREWHPETVDSGLALDLLAHHTTPLGTAEVRQAVEVAERYGNRPRVIELLQHGKDRYLLAGSFRVKEERLLPTEETPGAEQEPTTGTSRLAHDTLAPLIRRRFRASDLPGQRASRVLQQRAVEWAEGKEGPPLDAADLAIVEQGETGMPARDEDEERLVAASRRQQDRRRRVRRGLWVAGAGLVAAIAFAGGFAWWQWKQAEESTRVATAGKLAATALNKLDDQLDLGLLLSAEAAKAASTFEPRNALLLSVQSNPRLRIHLHGHVSWVTSLAFAPDGSTLASAGIDGTIHLWDVVAGQLLGKPLIGHEGAVSSVVFAPDGLTLASTGTDGTVLFWDVGNGQLLGRPSLGLGDALWSAAFAPDGSTLVFSSEDGTLRLWDVASGQLIGQPLTGHEGTITSVAFAPDGSTVASAGADGTLRLWDPASRQLLGPQLTGHDGVVSRVAFAPDGTALASAGADGSVRLWSVASGQPLGEPLGGHDGEAWSVAFTPDGKTLASAGADGTVRLWSVATGQPLGQPLSGHRDPVFSVAFSPNGSTLASAGADGTVRLWNLASGPLLGQPLIDQEDGITSVAFAPDGSTLVSAGSDGTVRLWDVATGQPRGQPMAGHEGEVWSVAFAPDGAALASAGFDGTVRLWDVATGQSRGQPMTGHEEAVSSVAFAPDGAALASAGIDGTVRLWDPANGRLLGQPLTRHEESVWSVTFAPEGGVLASASGDGTVRLWDAASGQPQGQPLIVNGGGVTSVAFSPEAKILASAHGGGKVYLWDVDSGRLVGQPLTGHEGIVLSVAFALAGRTEASVLGTGDSDDPAFKRLVQDLASGGADGTVRLWDPGGGLPIGQPLTGHEGQVSTVVFAPDGRILASAGQDGTVWLWDVSKESWVRRACARANRNLSLAEWRQFIGPDVPYRLTCPDLPAWTGVESTP